MRDAVVREDVEAAAQHLGEHAAGVDLRRRQAVAQLLGFSFEGNPQEAGVQVDIHPLRIGPDRVAGMEGGVGLRHDPMHTAESIDDEVVRALFAHIFEE